MALKDFKILTKDTLIYGIGNASNRIIQVLLAPLYAAYLSADRFGIRALTAAIYGVWQILAVCALDQAIIADYYQSKTMAEKRRVVSTGFTFSIVASLIVGGLNFIFAGFLARIMGLDPVEGVRILRLFSVYTIFTPPTLNFLAFLRSEQRSAAYSIFAVSKSIVRVALIVLFLVVLKRELIGLYEADALLAAGSFPVLLIAVYYYSKGIRFSFKSLKSMLGYSLPLLPMLAFVWVRSLGDRFIIKLFLTQADVGIFTFAQNFPNAVSFLLTIPLTFAWIPYAFSMKERTDLPQMISRVLTYFLLIAGWALVVLGGNAYELLRIIAKRPDYWEGTPLIPLLVLGMCLYGAYYIIATPCNIKRKTGYFTITTLISTLIAIVLNVVLLPLINLLGAAVAYCVSYGVLLLTMVIFSRRLMKIPYEIKRILLISIVAIGITLGSYFFHLPSPLIGFLVKLGAGSVAYLGILVLLGFMVPSEREFIKRLFHRSSGKMR